MAEKLEDLLVWTKAVEMWDAIDPLLERPGFGKNRDLRDQIRDAIDSVVANISEGFEQPTDRSFAQYLYRAKASAGEVRARLFLARRRGHITDAEHERAAGLCTELCKMLGSFIGYLYRCKRTQRGLGPGKTATASTAPGDPSGEADPPAARRRRARRPPPTSD